MKTYWDSSALIEALHDREMRERIKPDDNGTRPHALVELFSTLTKGVDFRYPPDDAAKMLLSLVPRLNFFDLASSEVMDAIQNAGSQGVRSGRIHDLMHAWAAKNGRLTAC
ncbi:MAG TPA: hypothetical protein VGY56_11605 [Verrucomicrobiae bacterium]|nr:hypothetical protein [Verrucomicrobiae bacterium]